MKAILLLLKAFNKYQDSKIENDIAISQNDILHAQYRYIVILNRDPCVLIFIQRLAFIRLSKILQTIVYKLCATYLCNDNLVMTYSY